ncbi:MAG: restriction endonuclease subunit S [Chitinophagaceae bacterium]|nr:restriction endonuclease subunit S [Chitinophagaceae bacterium]
MTGELIDKKIGDLVEKKIEIFNKNTHAKNEFTYIDISSVDNITKKVIEARSIPVNEAPSRAKYILKKGDIIVANVRPNLNAVALINESFDGAIGSSGFTVLRPLADVSNDFLFYNLVSPKFIEYVEDLVQGAMYPAINDTDVKRFSLKIPKTKSNQRNIAVDIKRKTTQIEQMRQSALQQKEAVEALQGALLREVFPYKEGDELPKGWKWEKIGNIMDEDRTQVQPYDEEFKNLPFIGLENIVSNTRQYTDEEYNPPTSTCFKFSSKHVLYGKLRPYLNKVFLPSADGKCSMEILPLLSKNGYGREFIAAVLQSETVIGNTVKFSTGGRMPRADIKKLRKLSVAIPADSEECNKLGSRVAKKIESLIKFNEKSSEQLEAIEALPAAILREVFEF